MSDEHNDAGDGWVVPARLIWAAKIAASLVAIAVAVLIAVVLLWELRVVVLPVFIALLLCTFLVPPKEWLVQRGWSSLLATVGVFTIAALMFAGIVTLIAPQVVGQLDELGESTEAALDELRDWVVTGPLAMSQDEVDDWLERAQEQIGDRQEELASGVIAGALVAAEVIVGLVLTIVLTFFFVKDGERITSWILDQVRSETAEDLRAAGGGAVRALTGYFRGTTIDGIVEGILIGTGLWLLGVPLALPLAVLTFFGGYFPLVGALVAGTLAALVALATEGPLVALAVIALALVVQNVASNLLDPLILARTVKLHPVVVLVVITAGGVLGGIIGAFLAVPITAAAVNVATYYLHDKPGAHRWQHA